MIKISKIKEYKGSKLYNKIKVTFSLFGNPNSLLCAAVNKGRLKDQKMVYTQEFEIKNAKYIAKAFLFLKSFKNRHDVSENSLEKCIAIYKIRNLSFWKFVFSIESYEEEYSWFSKGKTVNDYILEFKEKKDVKEAKIENLPDYELYKKHFII